MSARLRTPRRSYALRASILAVAVALGCTQFASAHAQDASVPAQAVSAHPENLMDVYREALQQDPILKQAEAASRIGQAGAESARAVLLPQINGSISMNDSHGTSYQSQLVDTPTGPEFLPQPPLSPTTSSGGLRSRSDSIGLNQVLFDLGDFEQWRAGKASARAAEAQYVSAQQNLILRVAQAYFTVLTDEDQLKFSRSNAASLKKQMEQSQAQYEVGFAAVTAVADAKAAYDGAKAQVIAAENQVFNDRQALAQITGQAPGKLEILTDKLPLDAPQPNNMQAWVTTALASNPSLHAARDSLESAQHGVVAAHAAHLPSLGATISYSRNPSWGPGNINTAGLPSNVTNVLRADSRRNDTTVGLVLTVPLFQGGGIIAREKQAIASRDQTRDVLEQDRRQTVANTRNAFDAIAAGISSVEADKAAVASAELALKATEAGFQVGTNTITEVLIAQSTLFQAQGAYSQARHALVINRLNLKFSAGTLDLKDLEKVNALLQ